MCEYLHIEPEGLAMLLELANRKLRVSSAAPLHRDFGI